jgi:hypothetical protein
MKHRRGVNLIPANAEPTYMGETPSGALPTLESLAEWFVLGGRCVQCEREAWIDRWELQRRYGKKQYIVQLQPFLRCRKCGSKGHNRFILGKLAR